MFLILIKPILTPLKKKSHRLSHVRQIYGDICRIEQECLGLKEIAFNKELLKLASFDKLAEKERTVENANKIAAELTRFDSLSLWSII